MDAFKNVTTLTFDVYGTCLDLNGPLVPALADLVSKKGSKANAEDLRKQWRSRQRIEQYQDTLISLGHSGYLETSRRALLYTLRQNGVPFDDGEIEATMRIWWDLDPFDDVVPALKCLKEKYRLVALSNGNVEYLNHITRNRIGWEFDAVISCDAVGVFKPHPAVYRHAARELELEPGQIGMVAAHAFDVMGARACGYRGVYVNRYGLPYEETPSQPDVTVKDFNELPEALL